MIRDITIGQYYPANSVIHRLDPRIKLLGTIVFIVSVFFIKDIKGLLLATIALGSVIRLSTIPLKYMLKGLRAIFVLLLFTVALNVFLTPGDVLFKVAFIKVTKEGLVMAAQMAVRLVYLIVGSTIMTLTTTPNNLTDGVPHLYAPPSCGRQRAASVASYGAVLFSQGKTIPGSQHAPLYLRKSQAEREREQKGLS